MLTKNGTLSWILVLLALYCPKLSAASFDECKDIFGAADLDLTHVPIHIDPSAKPEFRSKELWVLQIEKEAISARIRRHESSLKNEEKPAFWWADFLDMFSLKDEEQEALTPEQKDRLTAAVKILQARKKRVEALIGERQAADRLALIQRVSGEFAYPSLRAPMFEYMKFLEVLRLPRERTVTLLAGNPEVDSSPELIQQVGRLAYGLAARGYSVIYDADSKLAPVIRAAAREKSIGVTAKTISNVFLRMRAFEHGSQIIMTTDSLTGLALRLKDKVNFVLTGDPKHNPEMLDQWHAGLEGNQLNLGIMSFHKIAKAHSFLAILDARSEEGNEVFAGKNTGPFPKRGIRHWDLPHSYLEGMLEYAHELKSGNEWLERVGGAVIFGAGKMSKYTSLIYDSTRVLAAMGIPIVTGGAGGAMRVANTAAYDGGVDSIGIPIGGRNQLMSERKVHSEVQTGTFVTRDYATRIPLLMKNKGLIVAVPGGSGTLQEIAAAFIQFAAHTPASEKSVIVLVGKDYYQGLYDYIHHLHLPEQSKSQVFLVDSAKELQEVVELNLHYKRLDPDLLIQNHGAYPRTDRTSFPIEESAEPWGEP